MLPLLLRALMLLSVDFRKDADSFRALIDIFIAAGAERLMLLRQRDDADMLRCARFRCCALLPMRLTLRC